MLLRLTALAGALLMLAACGNQPEPAAGGLADPARPVGLGAPGGIGASRFGPGSQQDLAATAGDRIFFAFDSAEITPEAQLVLQRQAEWLKRYPNVTVTIEGHTDERGTREYNLALGERRAQAARNVLVALGISRLADLDDQLRQGAARCSGLDRRSLRAEPPGGDGGQLRARA